MRRILEESLVYQVGEVPIRTVLEISDVPKDIERFEPLSGEICKFCQVGLKHLTDKSTCHIVSLKQSIDYSGTSQGKVRTEYTCIFQGRTLI